MARFRKRGFFKTLGSLIRVKLVAPMIRSKCPPEITARGSLIGMGWAMTPLVGIQMYLVFMTWVFCKKFLKWDFSLPVGLAWTWVTNVFTMPPIYYGFYVTGKVMMGEFAERTTYAKFYDLISTVLAEDGVVEALKALFAVLIKDWGFAMMVGSIPWVIIGGWGAYRWTLWYMRRRRANLEKRLATKQKRIEKRIEKIEDKQRKLEEKLEQTILAKEEAIHAKAEETV